MEIQIHPILVCLGLNDEGLSSSMSIAEDLSNSAAFSHVIRNAASIVTMSFPEDSECTEDIEAKTLLLVFENFLTSIYEKYAVGATEREIMAMDRTAYDVFKEVKRSLITHFADNSLL